MPRSLAEDAAAAAMIEKVRYVSAQLKRMRDFRRPYDAQRSRWYRQYLSQRDGKLFPDNKTPRSNTSVPYPRSNVEVVVTRTMDAFFSIDPPIETTGRGEANEASAPNMQSALLLAVKRAHWQQSLEILIRNIAIYGFAGIKVDWDWNFDTVTAPDPIIAMQPQIDQLTQQPLLNPDGTPSMMPIIDPFTGAPLKLGVQIVTKDIPRYQPKFTPIDIFDLLMDPDGNCAAHLIEKPFGLMLREAKAKPDLYMPGSLEMLASRLQTEKYPEDILIRQAEYWDKIDNTVTLMTFAEDNEAISRKNERYAYRNASYTSYKQKVYGGEPILLQDGPNPFIHKRIPILTTSYTKLTGEPFGVGVIEPISDLNESLNKFCNMIADNWNMGINRRYAYDTNANIDHKALNQTNVPGGKIGVDGNPNDVLFPLPTMVPNQNEFMILQLYKQMIELSSGISDFYGKGVGSSGGNRTATGIGQVITESNFIFKQFIRNLEVDVLQPMLEMTASMIQQYCTDYVEYEMTGAAPGIPKLGTIPLEQLVGNYSFDFVGANYATNKVIRQRNLMGFYQLASQTPYANQGAFLAEMGKVMEIPNISRLVKSDQQVMQEQQQGVQQQQEMMLLEKLLDTESKALVAELGKAEPNGVTAHALEVQEIIEDMLETAGELRASAGSPPGPKAKEGRPSRNQPEGKTPGSDGTGAARSLGQDMGANGLGLGGMSNYGGGN